MTYVTDVAPRFAGASSYGEQRDIHRLVSRLLKAFLIKVILRKAGPVAARRRKPVDGALPDERWSVRYWLPGGTASDVIGWIETVDETTVRLATLDSSTQVIPRSMIIAARRAPAAAGGPDPRRIPAHELQRHAVRGWLAWHEPLGEWTLRAAGGFTRRANSCHAVGNPGMSIQQAADRIIAFATAHGISVRAQVIEGSPEEHALCEIGRIRTSQPTVVFASRLADFVSGRPAEPAVQIRESLQPDWELAYQRSRPNSADPAIVRMILDGSPPRAFAAVVGQRPDDHPDLIAIARGHRSGDWLGFTSIWIVPDHRKHGLAAAMMARLGHWAARQGARYAYVQVATVNEAAVAAYTKLGFSPHHRYLYLAPAAERPRER
jgi:GNAT superfamily N-acetyltransferase